MQSAKETDAAQDQAFFERLGNRVQGFACGAAFIYVVLAAVWPQPPVPKPPECCPEAIARMPAAATDRVDIGNGWATFRMTVDGTERRFLFKAGMDRFSGQYVPDVILELRP